MRILQVCPRLPWPPHDGGRVAMLQITRSLQRLGHDVTVASLNPLKHRSNARDLDDTTKVETVDIDTSDLLGAAMRATRGDLPLLVARFVSAEFAELLRRLARESFDVIHLEGQFLLPYVSILRAECDTPIVLRAQNVEYRIWETLAENARGTWRRLALQRVAKSLREWETEHLDDCDALVPISHEDAELFRALGGTRPMFVLPCGVDAREYAPAPGDPLRFYFAGSMLYRPNQEAARWLAEELWPRVIAREPRAKLTIAGSNFPDALRASLESRGLEVAADVPDIRTFATPFGTMLAPTFSGSGMRIKVLEAMALAKTVIATPLGIAGLDAVDGRDVFIGSDADSFANAVLTSIGHATGSAARELIERRYDADTLTTGYVDFLQSGLRRPKSPLSLAAEPRPGT